MTLNKYLKTNQQVWDEWATIHMSETSDYDVAAFKAGQKGITPNIPDDIGSVEGKSILHLQCHFGMDSLMWTRQGAMVTGVDFSSSAIQGARALNNELGLNATFVEADIYSLPEALAGQFDIVMTYFGTIVWLPDLKRWAEVIAHFLKPGGFFYIADTHPFAHILAPEGDRPKPDLCLPYFTGGQAERYEDGSGTYADPDAKTENNVTYEWTHTMADIINSLVEAGLDIKYLHEFAYSFYNMYYYHDQSLMKEDDQGWWHLSKDPIKLPLMFSLMATKP
ncbi:MAG: class I SAM-dependent methyltransferase [Chloroflexota bacterium]